MQGIDKHEPIQIYFYFINHFSFLKDMLIHYRWCYWTYFLKHVYKNTSNKWQSRHALKGRKNNNNKKDRSKGKRL